MLCELLEPLAKLQFDVESEAHVACIVIPHLQAKAERILPDTDAPYDCRVFTRVVDGLTTISDRIEAAAPGTV